MVLSPQAQRAWKTVTAVVTAGTAFHVVFQVDYGDHDHVFTDIQRWYKKKMDQVFIGDLPDRRSQTTNSNTEAIQTDSVNDKSR